MMSVSVAWRAAEDRNDHMRTKIPNDAHDIAENRILWPVLVRLFGALREPKIVRAREVLMSAVDAARGEQLLSANRAEGLTELIADEVLATVTPGEREIRRLHLAPTRQPGDELCILVVGMRGDDENPRVHAEAANELSERGGAGLLRRCARGKNEKRGQRRDQSASSHASKSTSARQSS